MDWSTNDKLVDCLRTNILVQRQMRRTRTICNLTLGIVSFASFLLFLPRPERLLIVLSIFVAATILCNIPFRKFCRIPNYIFELLPTNDASAIPLCLEAYMCGWIDDATVWETTLLNILAELDGTKTVWSSRDNVIMARYARNSDNPHSGEIAALLPYQLT